MPRKSKRNRELDTAAEEAANMRAKMIKFFSDSLDLVTATSDPIRIKSMVDAYSKVMGFYESAPTPAITPEGKPLPNITPEDTRRAFARLLDKQASMDDTPPQ